MPISPRAPRRDVLRFAALVAVIMTSACGGGESTPPGPAPVATIQLTPATLNMYVGATMQLNVTLLDAGGATLTGRALSYSTNNGSIAVVSSTGAVTATGVGSTIIHVLSEGKNTDATINVALVPVSSVVVAPPAPTVGLGGSIQLTAATRDSANGTLTGRTVTWTTSAPAIATVTQAGVVSGVAAGTATIRATAEGKFGESTVTVSSAATPSITSVAPAVLLPGTAATITGTNFAGTVTDNTVTVDGVAATVTAASATQISIVVPTLPCAPTHPARVQVIAQGLGATALQPARAGTLVAVDATNAQRLLSLSEAGCAELPAGSGKFVVSVFDVDQAPTSVVGFRLTGALPPASLAASLYPSVAVRQVAAAPVTRDLPAAADPMLGGVSTSAAERMHLSIMEGNRAIYSRLRGTRTASRSLAPSSRSATAIPAVGDTRKFRVAQFSTALNATGSCNNFVEVTARVVYVGSRSIVYEDVAAPLATTMDSYYRNIGMEYDASMFVVDSTYFGDPLVTDPGTDADQHLNMVFTPSITTGIAGFVISCDFFPRNATTNQVSNLGENFYAVVPTVAGTGFSTDTPDAWLRGMRHTIVHEVKHIASFGARIVNNANNFEESWLEEGMARHAEELWERNYVYNVAWKGNTAYHESAYCDVRPTFSECIGRPFGIFNHFSTLYQALDAPGAYSIFGRVADNDFHFYASSWSLVRYALDRYATTEATFLRGITQSTTTTGLASISAQTGGHSATELLTNWSLAMYLDDTSANPDLGFPTWNTHDIYLGMNKDFGSSSFPKPFPLTPQLIGSPAFTADNAGIHGGSFAMYLVPSTTTSSTTLRLSSPNDAGPANASLRVAVVRIP